MTVAAGLDDQIAAKIELALEEHELDALIATSPENVAWASSASPPSQKTVRSRLAAAVVARGGDGELVAISLEGPVVTAQSRLPVRLYEEFVDDPVAVFADSLRSRGVDAGVIGVEATHLSHADYSRFAGALPKAELRPADALFSELRMVKTPAEIDAIRDIGAAADRIATEVCETFGSGSTEREIANFVAERYSEAGGDGLTMLVVGSGVRSAAVNAPPTGRVLERGDILRLDIIGTKARYHSDVARTAVVGEPTAEQQDVYDRLRDVHERCLAALRPGAVTSEIYALYRGAMQDANLPPYHFVGHGLGITLHEDPFVNNLSSLELSEGMVLCIEPLTLLPGRFGIQIEDEVLITAGGYEPFSRAGALLRMGTS